MRIDPIPVLEQQLGRVLAELLKEGNADDISRGSITASTST